MRTRSFTIRSAAAAVLIAGLAACGSDDTGPELEQPDGTEASPPTTDAGSTPPTGDGDRGDGDQPAGEPTEEEAEQLVEGESESDAEAAIEERGWQMRVVKRDGEDLVVTEDFRPRRVNVAVVDGTVTGVEFIG